MPTFFSVTSVTLPETAAAASTLIEWKEAGVAHSALWRSERGAPPPRRIVAADDTMAADDAYRLACEGTGLLWRGDFQNARQMVQALARRIDKPPKASKLARVAQKKAADNAASGVPAGQDFHLHRQAQSQRARVLGMVLIEFGPDYGIELRRAPDAKQACAEAWGAPGEAARPSVASLRELLGVISAHEWRKKGVEIAALGEAPNNRIHPHYGVFSPVRGEYVDLVANAPLPANPTNGKFVAFDIGTGTGVLAAVLALRGEVDQVVATDMDPRALECARENIYGLRLPNPVKVMQADLFPEGQASVIVCNPPWLPARPGSPLEGAVYDEGSRMLLGFIGGLAAHLAPGGEGWLILSNFAEKLGLRTRAELQAAIKAGGLKVLGRIDAKPEHPKAADESNPLHKARAAEVTSLWRLGAA
ncbi:MAG: methyltransferase small [Polaromonas sp.]|nr:methyltransferase small [Polaromonas sp.]